MWVKAKRSQRPAYSTLRTRRPTSCNRASAQEHIRLDTFCGHMHREIEHECINHLGCQRAFIFIGISTSVSPSRDAAATYILMCDMRAHAKCMPVTDTVRTFREQKLIPNIVFYIESLEKNLITITQRAQSQNVSWSYICLHFRKNLCTIVQKHHKKRSLFSLACGRQNANQ